MHLRSLIDICLYIANEINKYIYVHMFRGALYEALTIIVFE